ncbi:ABC transporter permease [Fibrivirga algicola]|uniref:FtsX-like permease family protein n=1 Tax=Fibrivirga algicola TaxID=2950420 RepID=A0ABX0QGG4_9BACT|nr:ABC transporter permease [Fibrivirga algicola]NID11480.1 FtsX-like permease family protein [Fibrivirga algicola]
MIRHLFTLIWNKKRAHSLLIIEIWASFLVLFGLASLLVYNLRNYREPLGFSYENVWVIDLNNNQDTTDVGGKVQLLMQRINAYPEVESASRMSDNSPFSANTMNSNVDRGKRKTMMDFYVTDENFVNALDMQLSAGRWYTAADSVGKYRAVVINQKAKEKLFDGEDPIGQLLGEKPKENDGSRQMKIIGVVDNFKAKGEFMTNKPALFQQLSANETYYKKILVKLKPGTDAVFEAKLVKNITAMVTGWSVDVDHLTESRKNQHNLTLVPAIIFVIVCSFLLINVALGLFGVLNVSITRRRGEIGLRRALGATEGSISWQFVGEMWVLATFALVLGLILACQFPLLNVFDLASSVYVIAIIIAALIVYLLVTLCALFPSRQAATIQPAVALHEE